MDDEARTPHEDQKAATESERREEARPKNRLRDLDVSDPDGASIKGGIPKQVRPNG